MLIRKRSLYFGGYSMGRGFY